ncbi:MAG: nucleotidyltransferase family protein [Mobilitalea sp.]
MKCVILAAGYATRLYPLTENLPKSLLMVAGKTILEHILAKVEEVAEVDEVLLVSNAKFAEKFNAYISGYKGRKPISVLNDGTWDNEHRLGAIADLALAIEQAKIDDDVLVLAGDNLFDFSLKGFASFFHIVQADCITTHYEESLEALKRTGVAELNSNAQVLSFEEKPIKPRSNNAVPPFYIYTKKTIELIQQFLDIGENADAPGQFVAWLVKKKAIYAYHFKGKRYDIGSVANYQEAKRIFE